MPRASRPPTPPRRRPVKSKQSEPLDPWRRRQLAAVKVAAVLLVLFCLTMLLASCSSLGKPERQPSPVAPACSQRAPALDSGDPPSGADVTDWMAWAAWGVRSQWAIVDRDNKRAATADCLDKLAEIKP
ncbi:hypothetical protein KEM14_gp29 [Xanthomonas virus phiXaf18]|uniref:Uncharacterized protein n=1 Tax=Xanthomonas virus phiXaf18 TaxID=2653651 RepID=A0A5P8PQK6_9CAUD|nr:hypothetical protein KEM14_gp29 [Xanthomonas virus phiXaf18]QFR59545.1 hypothetical protein phiXaf18_29 [Xanthomonas virus phiXaf18]